MTIDSAGEVHAASAALLLDRAETRSRIESMSAELLAVAAAVQGSNIDDEHDPEGSTVAFEREQLAALRARARVHLDEIDAALARIATGDYGRCVRCGGPIGDGRLSALPAAACCVRCATARSGR